MGRTPGLGAKRFQGRLEKKTPEQVTQTEEDQDHDRHDGGHEAHHLKQL
jgi:hypothetical protein